MIAIVVVLDIAGSDAGREGHAADRVARVARAYARDLGAAAGVGVSPALTEGSQEAALRAAHEAAVADKGRTT